MTGATRALTRVAFRAARRKQHDDFNINTVTPIGEAVGECVFRATHLAMQDVEDNEGHRYFRVVNAPTASGKTTSVAAAIYAAFSTRDFSCAYVVETIRQVEEVGKMIGDLIGPANVTVWTGA